VASKPIRPASSAPSIIGSDVRITGNLSTAGEIQLDGVVEGDVQAASLTMGEQGSLKGTVTAERIVIRGKVDGSIRGRTVILEQTAKVAGDVFHETVSIEAGATIDGKFTHTTNPLGNKTGGAEPAKPDAPKPEMALVNKS